MTTNIDKESTQCVMCITMAEEKKCGLTLVNEKKKKINVEIGKAVLGVADSEIKLARKNISNFRAHR